MRTGCRIPFSANGVTISMGTRLMTLASRFQKFLVISAVGIGALCAATCRTEAAAYVQTNLVSDLPGLAKLTEPELVNP